LLFVKGGLCVSTQDSACPAYSWNQARTAHCKLAIKNRRIKHIRQINESNTGLMYSIVLGQDFKKNYDFDKIRVIKLKGVFMHPAIGGGPLLGDLQTIGSAYQWSSTSV